MIKAIHFLLQQSNYPRMIMGGYSTIANQEWMIGDVTVAEASMYEEFVLN